MNIDGIEQRQKNGFDIEKFMSKANPRDFSYGVQKEERVFNEKRFVSKMDEHQEKIKAKKLHFKVKSELQKADFIINREKHTINQSFRDRRLAKKVPCRIDLSKTEYFEENQNFRNAISPQPFCRKIMNIVHKPKVLLAFHNKITLTLNSVDEHEHNKQLPEVKMKFNKDSECTKGSYSPLSPSAIEHNRRHINTSKNILKEAVNSPTCRLPVSPRHILEEREYANRNKQFRIQPNQLRLEKTNENCAQEQNSAMTKQNKQRLNPLKEKVIDLIKKCDEYLIK